VSSVYQTGKEKKQGRGGGKIERELITEVFLEDKMNRETTLLIIDIVGQRDIIYCVFTNIHPFPD